MAREDHRSLDIYFQEILRQGLQDQTIQNVVLVEKRPVVKEGENHLGELTRVTLKYSCNDLNEDSSDRASGKMTKIAQIVIKAKPNGGTGSMILEMLRHFNIFNTERVMLEGVVPRMEQLLGKRLGPKIYYSSMKPSYIVMEDLLVFGFKNADGKVGLNKQQVYLVLDNLADFHATSVLLNEQDSVFVSRFVIGIGTFTKNSVLPNFISKRLTVIAEEISTWPDKQFALIAEKLWQRIKHVDDDIENIYKCDEDELKVLNHGDLWFNNIMIRHDENGQPKEARFIDYQFPTWSSPAIDLHNFLTINPELSIKMTHDDIFLQQYLARLANTMKRLGCSQKPPTMEQLKKSLYNHRVWALWMALVFFPKFWMTGEVCEPLEEIVQNDGATRFNPMKYFYIRKTMEKILPILNERGYLD